MRDASHYRVLLCGQHVLGRKDLQQALTAAGYLVSPIASAAELKRARLNDNAPSVAIVDFQDQAVSGHLVIQELSSLGLETQTLVLSPKRSTFEAVEADRRKVFWYLSEPISSEEILFFIAKASVLFELAQVNKLLLQSVAAPLLTPEFIATSAFGKDMLAKLDRLAGLDTSVLITGETGTGKTTLARLLHKKSTRANKPFVSVSCASIPRELLEAELFGHEKGAFTGAITTRLGSVELAQGGTLFLDEIGDLPLELQPKLLTFLQDREIKRVGGSRNIRIDVRVIAATNKLLPELVRQKQFREDLYFRLNVVELHMTPLRERRADIPDLISNYLHKLSQRRNEEPCQVQKEALAVLQRYNWPGNIRELENVLERASIFAEGRTIRISDIPYLETGARQLASESTAASGDSSCMILGKTLAQLEQEAVEGALRHYKGDKREAANMLGISLKTIYNKIKLYGIVAPD